MVSVSVKMCDIKNCTNDMSRDGLCKNHYDVRWRKIKNGEFVCAYKNCIEKQYAFKICRKHWQNRRYGMKVESERVDESIRKEYLDSLELKKAFDAGDNTSPDGVRSEFEVCYDLGDPDDHALNAIKWIETHLFIKGEDGGLSRVVLYPWQKRFIANIYSRDDNGKYRKRHAVSSMARKNGKTELTAFLILLHLDGTESIHDGQIYAAASAQHQAKYLYKRVQNMIEWNRDAFEQGLLKHDPIDTRMKVLERGMEHLENGTTFKAISKKNSSAQGLNASLVVIDELAHHDTIDLYNSLLSGQSYKNPLSIAISTRSNKPANPLDEVFKFDKLDSYYIDLYEVPTTFSDSNDDYWYLANPSIKHDVNLLEAVIEHEKTIHESSTARNRFQFERLNQSVNPEDALITRENWEKNHDKEFDVSELHGKKCYGGLDLSNIRDLTAFALYFPDDDAFLCWSWLPEAQLYERQQSDKVPYMVYAEDGTLLTTSGSVVDKIEVARDIEVLCQDFDVEGIYYDRALIKGMIEHPEFGMLDIPRFIEFDTSWRKMVPAWMRFDELLQAGKLRHDGNPLLTRAASAVVKKVMAGGSIMPMKRSGDDRVDPLFALFYAIGGAIDDEFIDLDMSTWI